MKIRNKLDFFIVVGAFILVFVSSDANLAYQNKLTLFFRSIFYEGIGHPRLFRFMDYIFIIIGFLLMNTYGKNIRSNKQAINFLFWITILNSIFLMLNPNSQAELMIFGLPLLSDVSIYSSILFMYFLFYVSDLGFTYFIRTFGKAVLIFATIKVLFLIIFWMLDVGVISIFGISSSLMEEDTLLLFAFLQLVFLYLFFIYTKKKYLLIWFFFAIIILLSLRRSGFLLALITTIGLLLYRYISERKQIILLIVPLMFILLSLIVLSVNIAELPNNVALYLNRYFGSFFSLPNAYKYDHLAHNEHLEQAKYGFERAIEDLSFWGYGYGHNITKAAISYKSNSAIHNSYVAAWMFHGLFYTIYLLIMGIMVFVSFTKNLVKIKENRYLRIFQFVVGFYLIIYFINHWVLPLSNVVELKMIIFRTILLALFFRMNQTVYTGIFSFNKQ